MRTRSKWRPSGRTRSLAEQANALAYIAWQVALDGARNLHQEDFDYADDAQRTGVIAEYLCFAVHLGDRLVHGRLDDPSRAEFVGALAHGVARHYQRNLEDVYGRGRDDDAWLIATCNTRAGEYADCTFAKGSAGFSLLRALARHVQRVMGDSQVNRWVFDQVIEIDGPGAVDQLTTAFDNLFGSATRIDHRLVPD